MRYVLSPGSNFAKYASRQRRNTFRASSITLKSKQSQVSGIFPHFWRNKDRRLQDVLDSLAQVDFGIVPQENTTFGAVAETYDALRYRDCFVTGEIVLEIQHCLVARRGVQMESVDCIMSHEQVSETFY